MEHTFEFVSAQVNQLYMDTPKMLDCELLPFYKQDIYGLSRDCKGVCADSLKGFKSAKLYGVRTSACKHLLLALKLMSVKFKSFQELQKRASSRGLSLSAVIDTTKHNELGKKMINLKQRKAFQTSYGKVSRQVDYNACSNNSSGVAVESTKSEFLRTYL